MAKFMVSSKYETLLSLHECNKQKESLNQDKIQIERNFEKCATNHCKGEPEISIHFFVMVYDHFENAPTRNLHNFHQAFDQVEANFKLSYFSQKGASLELLNIVFENSLPKGFFWWNKKNLNFSIWHQILDNYSQRLLNTAFSERPEKNYVK